MALDTQINLFKVDTNAFLTDEENAHRTKLVALKKQREELYKTIDNRQKTLNQTLAALKSKETLKDNEEQLIFLCDQISIEEKIWKEYILNSAAEGVLYNQQHPDSKHIRQLSDRYIHYVDRNTGELRYNISNVISMFESALSRSFGIIKDSLTLDIIIVEIYYYDIAKDIILNGFDYNGTHYVYFSSSAGQIRTKKAVFVNEALYKEKEPQLMCGLSAEKINEMGGMNITKFLAYKALCNSATDVWKDFDIDRSIVVDDFETLVPCKVDSIDYETYEITPGVNMEIPIPHTDGCGMVLPELSTKNFMVRMPFMKGLLGVFDFRKFCEQHGVRTVKDIWGTEHDIFAENIQVIFTKSMLKMAKYYTWESYKSAFKQYNCEAGICNREEDHIPNAHINYQMLQTLYLATDKEIEKLCYRSNRKILQLSESLEEVLNFHGVLPDGDRPNTKWFQKAVRLYPELIGDPAAKSDLRDLKDSYVKAAKGGKLDVYGKFTFVLPDLYAFCEWLFCGTEVPDGILSGQDVYCRLYPEAEQLDCLRSPHLYIEHAVRNNVVQTNETAAEWFQTDAIYTSTHDPISRILQFDDL